MAHQPTILVTQPDAALQALIVRVLKTPSFRVLKAATASEALDLHAAETVDAIIIDAIVNVSVRLTRLESRIAHLEPTP